MGEDGGVTLWKLINARVIVAMSNILKLAPKKQFPYVYRSQCNIE